MAERAFLTGGTGFVGAALARKLLLDGLDVHLLVRPEHQGWRLHGLENDVAIHEGDLRDRAQLFRILRAVKPDFVFHLATYGAYSWQKDWQEIVRTNILGTSDVVEGAIAAGARAVVNAGSSSEYGFKTHPPAETEWLEPNSEYAIAKAAATHYCRLASQRHGVPVRTLRLYSVYGPWEEPARLVPSLVLHALHGRLPPLTDPATARDFVYVDDVCEAFSRAARSESAAMDGVYNIGSGTQTSLMDLVDLTRRLFRLDVAPEWGTMTSRVWDTNVWVAEIGKAKSELGWWSTTSLSDGLRHTAQWLRSDPERLELYWDRVAVSR